MEINKNSSKSIESIDLWRHDYLDGMTAKQWVERGLAMNRLLDTPTHRGGPFLPPPVSSSNPPFKIF